MPEVNETPVTPAEPKAASYEELKSKLVGADADFICGQLEAKATADVAVAAWMAEQNSRLEQAKAKAELPRPGVDALASGKAKVEQAGDPIEAFEGRVSELMAGGKSRPKAIAATVREDPELHAAYIAAYNAKHNTKR